MGSGRGEGMMGKKEKGKRKKVKWGSGMGCAVWIVILKSAIFRNFV
jgi:hypothetical protein